MTPDEQLALWSAGNAVHNGATRKHGECCPDFSCCMPGMMWPEHKRKAFVAADDETRSRMLIGALSGLMDYTENRGVKVIG